MRMIGVPAASVSRARLPDQGVRGPRARGLLATWCVLGCLLVGAAPGYAASLDQVEVSPTGSGPALVRNTADNEFFVVWSSALNFGGPRAAGDVVGRRLDARGRPLGPAITLVDGGATAVDVAYSRARREFLVVWLADASPAVRAQRVSRRGRPLGNPLVVADFALDPFAVTVHRQVPERRDTRRSRLRCSPVTRARNG
jgi:hypothetical protein